MNNAEKKGVLSIVGIGLSLAGVAVSAISNKVDDKLQIERIDNSVNQALDLRLNVNSLGESHVK